MLYRNLFIVLFLSILFACTQKDELVPNETNLNVEKLIFGTYHGECIGEACIEIFKVEGNKLFEDTEDNYPGNGTESRTFVERSAVENVVYPEIDVELMTELMALKNTQIGCPDCRDQGGVYLEIVDLDGVLTYWAFDRDKADVPTAFHGLIDVIVAAVDDLQ